MGDEFCRCGLSGNGQLILDSDGTDSRFGPYCWHNGGFDLAGDVH